MQSDVKDVYHTGGQRDSEDGKPLIASIDRDFLTAMLIGAYEARYYAAAVEPRGATYEKALGVCRMIQGMLERFRTEDDAFVTYDLQPIMDALIDVALLVSFNEWPPGSYVGSEHPPINPDLLWRFGAWLAMGAAYYGDGNWRLGIPASRVLSSLFRHVVQWGQEVPALAFRPTTAVLVGETFPTALLDRPRSDDDHAAAVLFNTMVLWVYLYELDSGDDDRLSIIAS